MRRRLLGNTLVDIHAALDDHVQMIAFAMETFACEQLKVEQPEMLLHSFAKLLDAPCESSIGTCSQSLLTE